MSRSKSDRSYRTCWYDKDLKEDRKIYWRRFRRRWRRQIDNGEWETGLAIYKRTSGWLTW